MKKLLLALSLSLSLLGVSFSALAGPGFYVTVNKDSRFFVPQCNDFIFSQRTADCASLLGLGPRVHSSYTHRNWYHDNGVFGCYNERSGLSSTAICGVYYSSYASDYDPFPEPTPSCNEGLSESCCEQLAHDSCADHGGCAEWSYQGPDAIGGERCDFTCYDDLEEPDPNPGDGGDDGTDPGDGGDDGADPGDGGDDGTDPGDGGDDGTDPGDGDDDGANPGDGDGGDDDWDYTPPEPGQGAIINVGGGSGSGGVTVDVDVDTSAIEAWLQILADKPGFDDSRINSAINALRDSNSTLLDQIASSVTGPVNVDSDTYMVVPGVDSVNPGGYDHGYFSSLGSKLADDTDLPADFTSSEFELDSIDISDRFDDFDLFLPNADCIGYRSYNINGLSFDVDWSPLCDIFSWLGLLVVTSAWFFTPFIVFGTSKK